MQSTGKPNNARPNKKKKNADETATLIIPQITPEVIARAREAMAQGMSAEEAAKLATAEAAEAAAAKATAAKAAAEEVAAARAAARAAAKVSVKPRTPARPRVPAVSANAEIRNAVHPGVSVRARPQQTSQPSIAAASAALSAPADTTASLAGTAPLDRTASFDTTAAPDTTSTINIPTQFQPTAALDTTAIREAAAADASATSSAITPTQATQTEKTAETPSAPKPKNKNRVKRSSKQGAKAGPGTRRQAERELYRSIHDDHLWLNNPMMVRGLGLAPAVVAASDGDNALMLCLAAFCLITLTRVLAVAICHLTGNRFRPLIYAYSAALVYIPTYVLMFELFGSFLTILGIYLPLLCVEPVVIKRVETNSLETVGEALHRGLNNSIGYCIALMLVGIVREFLASGTFFGTKLVSVALLPLAAQPAGGFILIGITCAIWTAIGGAYVHYKREEVRHLYADADSQ